MTSLRFISGFLQTAVLTAATTLLGACQRDAETTPSETVSAAASTVSSSPRDWRPLIEGCSSLPPAVEAAVRDAVSEDNLAINPRTALEERLPGTVSQERHWRRALVHYQTALDALPSDGECTVVRRRLQGRVTMLGLSIDSLARINGRFCLSD